MNTNPSLFLHIGVSCLLMQISVRTILGYYMRVVRQYPVSVALTMLSYGAGILLVGIVVPLYYREILDMLVASSSPEEAWPEVWSTFLIIAALICIYNVFWRIGDILIVWSQTRIMRELTNDALERLQKHSYTFFTNRFTGSIVAKVRRYVRSFETLHDKFMFNFWMTGVELLGLIVILSMTHASLGLFFACWVVFYMVLSYALARFHLHYSLKEAAEDSNVTGELADILTNIFSVKMFSSSVRELARFSRATYREWVARGISWHVYNFVNACKAVAMIILEIACMVIALYAWRDGFISASTVILIQLYLMRVMHHCWDIGRAMSDCMKALGDATEMVEMFEHPLGVEDPIDPEESRMTHGKIELKNVSFSYVDGVKVYDDFNLTITSGERIGVVGHSGGGKSTMFKLLLRYLDVNGGAITIDDQDIRTVTQDDLRRVISYVPQDPLLFHRSLEENIAYAKPDASKDEVIAAAKKAHAHEFITSLPDGYDTLVGERGVKLSGGERQRIAIARAILKEAPILLLDEATSSLDSISEQYIQEQLQELMACKTTLAIAHRVSTLRSMDRILVIDAGRIVEDGSHEELLAKKGHYADLWEHQSGGYLLES